MASCYKVRLYCEPGIFNAIKLPLRRTLVHLKPHRQHYWNRLIWLRYFIDGKT